MSPETSSKLSDIVLTVLDLPADTDVMSLRRINCEKWDSLSTVTMITALESELDIEFNSEQRDRFTSYQAIALLLDELSL